MTSNEPLSIESKIYTIRNKKVMLDSDLAELYGVDTKVLNQAVKRNIERFPKDFIFQLEEDEFESLRSQIVTSIKTKGGRTYRPHVFTEQGVAMLSGVIKSKQAIAVNITIMRAFVAMKNFMLSDCEIRNRIDIIQLQLDKLKNNSEGNTKKIEFIIKILEEMSSEENKNKIGFNLN